MFDNDYDSVRKMYNIAVQNKPANFKFSLFQFTVDMGLLGGLLGKIGAAVTSILPFHSYVL